MQGQEGLFEARRILKAFIDTQWLSEFDQRLAAYRAHAAESGAARAIAGRRPAGLEEHRSVGTERRGYGYVIEWREVNHRVHGRNRVSEAVTVPTEADALRLIGRLDRSTGSPSPIPWARWWCSGSAMASNA